jgi:beta-lactam-binding protein with PASTA domain
LYAVVRKMRWRRPVLLAVVLAVLGVSAVVGFVLTERGSEPTFVDSLVFIPTVVGKPEQKAITAVEAVGLKPEIRYERGMRRSDGLVVAAMPRGGSIVLIVAQR